MEHSNVHINLLCMCFCAIPSNGHTSLSTSLVLIVGITHVLFWSHSCASLRHADKCIVNIIKVYISRKEHFASKITTIQ